MQHLDTELLSSHIDGELPAADAEQVEAHLASCPQCQREFQELQGVARLVRELPRYQPRGNAHVRSSARSPRPISGMGRIVRPLAVAAIVIVVAIAGFRIIGDLTDDEPEDGAPGQLSQNQTDGTDEDRSASEPVADAPDTAADELEQPPMAAVQPGDASDVDQEAAESGESVMAPTAEVATAAPTQSPDDAGEQEGSSKGDRVRNAIFLVVGATIVGSAVWLLYQRTRRS